MLLWGTAHSRSSLHIGSVQCHFLHCVFFFHLLLYYVLDSVPETHKHEGIIVKISLKTVFLNFTGYVGLASSAGNSYCNGYTDREESENKKRRNKWGGSSLPKIEECGQRPSPLWTSDRSRGPLGVFIRLIVISPVP